MSSLLDAARVAVTKCLGVQADDYVLVVTDETCRNVADAFRAAAVEAEAETLYLDTKAREHDGEEPPIGVAEVMREMDVVIAPLAVSLANTDARQRASKAGARIVSLPGVTEAILVKGFEVDVEETAQRVRDIARTLHGRSEIHVTCANGTDLRFSMEGSRVFQDTGMIRQPGDFGTLPAGRIALLPAEGSARGDLVLDGSMFGAPLPEPVRLRIEGGKVVGIEGGGAASAALNGFFEASGPETRVLGEFGVGAHAGLELSGVTLSDEKVLGTCHFGFGNNRSLGGKVATERHETGIVTAPKVTVDGRTLVEEGQVKV